MANTAKGWPYPIGTDRVADGDNAIKAVADRLELRLGSGIAAGSVSIPCPTVGTAGTVTVTFPAGYFTVAPYVLTNAVSGVGAQQLQSAIASFVTVTGFTAAACRTNGTANVVSHWLALQV